MNFNTRYIAAATVILILLFGGAVALERSDFFSPLKQSLQTDKIPTAMVNYGVFGRIVTRLGLFRPAPNDIMRFVRTGPVQSSSEKSIFQKKRVVGDWLFEPADSWHDHLPSSKMVSGMSIIKNCPVISIAVNEEDLTGPEGIFTNYNEHGEKYERLASVSYFENGKMQFETYAGIRLHGGRSREKKNSYRLYFRKEYGMDRIDPGLLFENSSYAIKRLVVRDDHPVDEPFTTCFAFDISTQLGCTVPAYKSALCYLNGEYKGIYYLAEHLGRKQWEEHFGHQHFDFLRFKSTSDSVSEMNYREFVRKFSAEKNKFTMEFASQHVDLDNFTSFIMAIVFCGTTDALQGVVLRDRIIDASRWAWINWDMDHSFVDNKKEFSDNKERLPWEQEGMELVFPRKKYSAFRRSLFFKLTTEDPHYRKYFVKKFVHALNHIINEDYFNQRLDYYQDLANRMGRDGQVLLESKKDFITHRPQFIRGQLKKYFKLSPFHKYEVQGPKDIQYIIDGYTEKPGYTGYYSKEIPIQIEIAPGYQKTFAYWEVDGKPFNSKKSEESSRLSIYIPGRDVSILPVFK